ncbi:MAG: SpoIIE family protein phosphatase, partial [Leptospiraceae bacterium]|nr:SpoIIE family protein phosphatase [Leptospiraceae bacterium]
MIKFFSVLLIVILNPILLFSFPIQMKDNWKAFPRKNLDINSNPETWEEVPSLTFQSTQLKNFPKGEVINITLYKSFEISQEEYDNLDEDISVLFSYISNVYAVYLNGAKISESGKIENGEIIKNGSKGNVILHFPKKNLQPGVNHFYIVISGMKDEEVSVYGNAETSIDYLKNHQYTTRQRVSLILLSLYFFVGVYHLLLFYKRPQDIYNGFFSMFCIFASLYIFFRTNVIYEFDLDSLVNEKTEYILVYFTTLGMLLFFESFIKRKIYKPTKIYTLFIFIISIITAIFSKSLAAKMLLCWQLSAFYVLFRSSYLMIKGVKEKLPDAKRLMVGFFAMVVCLVLDLLGAMHVLPGLNNMEIAKYGFFIFVMGIAAMLANRFMILHNHVEELNRNLEHKVELRTAELRESLNHVQKLKFQQDGDYFLTSLLIKPLMVNEVHSDKVKIDFFIKQKKTFEFKNKIHEIGGDICIANNITLKNKNYCVFVNGDAMGKSIQGAGGALVLGVVFRAVISRTQINPSNRTPEQWLKSCFVELQNVFVSFDGSMLISVVMGLVDESTGMLFYINAEHPWVILYRDNIASFLEDSLSMRKIGMIGLDGDLQVKTFHLQPEDSLLIGSDGRDDLLLRINEKGERIINEDENLFLRTVEEGKGDLNS